MFLTIIACMLLLKSLVYKVLVRIRWLESRSSAEVGSYYLKRLS